MSDKEDTPEESNAGSDEGEEQPPAPEPEPESDPVVPEPEAPPQEEAALADSQEAQASSTVPPSEAGSSDGDNEEGDPDLPEVDVKVHTKVYKKDEANCGTPGMAQGGSNRYEPQNWALEKAPHFLFRHGKPGGAEFTADGGAPGANDVIMGFHAMHADQGDAAALKVLAEIASNPKSAAVFQRIAKMDPSSQGMANFIGELPPGGSNDYENVQWELERNPDGVGVDSVDVTLGRTDSKGIQVNIEVNLTVGSQGCILHEDENWKLEPIPGAQKGGPGGNLSGFSEGGTNLHEDQPWVLEPIPGESCGEKGTQAGASDDAEVCVGNNSTQYNEEDLNSCDPCISDNSTAHMLCAIKDSCFPENKDINDLDYHQLLEVGEDLYKESYDMAKVALAECKDLTWFIIAQSMEWMSQPCDPCSCRDTENNVVDKEGEGEQAGPSGAGEGAETPANPEGEGGAEDKGETDEEEEGDLVLSPSQAAIANGEESSDNVEEPKPEPSTESAKPEEVKPDASVDEVKPEPSSDDV